MLIRLSLFKTVFKKYSYEGREGQSIVTSLDVGGADSLSNVREIAEIKRLADLKPIVDDFADRMKAQFPDKSFSISVAPANRKERKVPGFDAATKSHIHDPLGLYRHVKTVGKNEAIKDMV